MYHAPSLGPPPAPAPFSMPKVPSSSRKVTAPYTNRLGISFGKLKTTCVATVPSYGSAIAILSLGLRSWALFLLGSLRTIASINYLTY